MAGDASRADFAQGLIQIAPGPRAVEALLLSRVAELCQAARREPRLLALPVRVVVPSRSLADHVGERIVAEAGHGVAGVRVQTLHGLALELLERAGEPAPASEALFPVLVRRLAAEEPLLRAELGALADGYASVEAAVADLLDAGFAAAYAGAVHDAIAAARGDRAALARAHAVARVAERCLSALQGLGAGHRSLLLAAAREALLAAPERALPARSLIVHGFADATGLRAELLETLVRSHHALVLMDQPPDPAGPERADAGLRFSERLYDRLARHAKVIRVDRAAVPATRLDLVEASGFDAEAREVAVRVRAVLGEGIAPERIGVVARDLAGHRAALRRHFRALGIPFSGPGLGGVGPSARLAGALLSLLREGAACRSQRWLDAAAPAPGPGAASALRGVLRRRGLLALGEVAACEAATPDLRGPAGAARATCAGLEQMAGAAGCAEQFEALEGLLRRGLGWKPGRAEVAPIRAALGALRAELDGQPALSTQELALILRRELARHTAEPLGGEGGGIQVLDATQARGRSFERLFLIGLLRDAFPRSIREEALLPDFVRESLRDVLPEIPVKRLGHDEERFLFAQLVAASPRVTLSWPRAGDDGRPSVRSGFVDRLDPRRESSPKLASDTAPRPLRERALRAALYSRERLAEVLPMALAEIASPALAGPAQALADARLRVLAEFEPSRRLGPYFGFVGALPAGQDRGHRPPAVTTFENLSRCAWQAFLRRLLRVAPPLDGDDRLPGSDSLLLGSVVHRVLEELAPADADPVRGAPPVWPDDRELERCAERQAAALLVERFIPLSGLARVLARQALPHLRRARALDAAEGERLRVVGCEEERVVSVRDASGNPRELRFVADRVERFDGCERLTDFKTGKPLSKAKRPEKRAQHFAAAVASGAVLQPALYALSAEAGGAGRLLYLDPEGWGAGDAASYVAQRGDPALGLALERSVATLFQAWDAGTFFPRLLASGLEAEPDACRRCEVSQACLRGDTAASRRLGAFLEDANRGGADALSAEERALLEAFRLGEAPAGADLEDA